MEELELLEKQKAYVYDIAASMAFEDMPLTKKEIKDLLSIENGTLSIRKLRAAILADAKKRVDINPPMY